MLLKRRSLKVYGKYLGGAYNYEMFELEYRQFQQVFRPRSTLAWIAKTQIGVGKRSFYGASFVLALLSIFADTIGASTVTRPWRMGFWVSSYVRQRGNIRAVISGRGVVLLAGSAALTIGNAPIVDWNKWKFNYGVGLRIKCNPARTSRLDVGKDPNQKGWRFYMNMTEAF